jgi:HEPN domain-containing protein
MGRTEKTNYWIDGSRYDLESARAMLKTRRFLYVGFLCHQTVELAIKAYHCSRSDEDPAYSHNLLVLCEKSGLFSELSPDQTKLLDELMPLNIQTRYPIDRESMIRSLSLPRCRNLMKRTEEFVQWILPFLKQ